MHEDTQLITALEKLLIPLLLFIFIAGCIKNTSIYAQDINPGEVGIDEKLGSFVRLDLTFKDEGGNPVQLKELVDRPSVIVLVYYECPGICSPLLNGLTDTLSVMSMEPGKEYKVITISFDENESSKIAAGKKKNYFKLLKRPFPDNAWRFLTGDKDSIKAFTDSVGFKFKRVEKQFVHPAGIIVISDKGKIIRYLYGISFLPFDLKMALVEASKGRPEPTINSVLRFCYSYEPVGRKYAINIIQLTGVFSLLFATLFFVYLMVAKPKRNQSGGKT